MRKRYFFINHCTFYYSISGFRNQLIAQGIRTEFSQEFEQLIGLLNPKIYQEVEEQVLNFKNNVLALAVHLRKFKNHDLCSTCQLIVLNLTFH